jgi:hypothetical protein
MFLRSQVEERMEGVKNKDADKQALARSRWLTKYIGGPETAASTQGQFKDPASMF